MAWTSGLFAVHWQRTLGGDAKTYVNRYLIDLSSVSNSIALYSNTATPVYYSTAATEWAAYTTTNEASGTGYTAKGVALTAGYSQTNTLTTATGVLLYSHGPVTWTTATITASGALWFNDAVTAGDTGGVEDAAFVGVAFGATYTSTAGSFVVTPAAGGVFSIDFY